MSTVIGIFDEDPALRLSLRRLDEIGVGAEAVTVLDPVAPAPGAGPREKTPGAGDAVLPGAGPSIGHPGVAVERPAGEARPDPHAVLRERLPSEVGVDFYTRVLEHDGRIVVVDVGPSEADQVSGLMEECGASRVDRHD